MSLAFQTEMKNLYKSIINPNELLKYTSFTLEEIATKLNLRKGEIINYFRENIATISEFNAMIFGGLEFDNYSQDITQVRDLFEKDKKEGQKLNEEVSLEYLKKLFAAEIDFEDNYEISAFNGINSFKLFKDFIKYKEVHEQHLIYETNFEFAELTEIIDRISKLEIFNKITILDWNSYARNLKPDEYNNSNPVTFLGKKEILYY